MKNLAEARGLVERMKKQGLLRGPGEVVAAPAGVVNGVVAGWEEVTPEMAKGWLERNRNNRVLRRSTVAAYAADMRDGNWVETHQGIAFDAEGWLLDGQHRLAAVVESGCTVRMLVARGLPAAVKGKRITTVEAMDRGAGRTVKDALKVRGISSPALASAVAAVIAQACVYPEKQGRVTMNQTLAILDLYQEHVEWLGKNEPYDTKWARVATVLGALAFGRAVAGKEVDRFFEALISGANLGAENAILHLRNWLMERSQLVRGAGGYNKGNNRERLEVSRRVLACLFYYQRKHPLKGMKDLEVDAWQHFVNAQEERVGKVRAVLGKAGRKN